MHVNSIWKRSQHSDRNPEIQAVHVVVEENLIGPMEPWQIDHVVRVTDQNLRLEDTAHVRRESEIRLLLRSLQQSLGDVYREILPEPKRQRVRSLVSSQTP